MDFYFTFGAHHMGYPGYVKITAPDAKKARDTMVKYYGRNWCGQYPGLHYIADGEQFLRDTLVWPE